MDKKFSDQKFNDEISGPVGNFHQPKGAQVLGKINEEETRFFLQNTPDIFLKIDPEGIIYFINRTVPGFSINGTIGKSMYEFIAPDYHELVRDSVKQVLESGCRLSFELYGVGPWGMPACYSTHLVPIRRHKKIVALAQFAKDITILKQLEESLLEKEENLKSKNRALEEISTAFRFLLKSIEKEKKQIEEQIMINIQQFVLPYLEKLNMTRMDEKQKSYVRLLESNLQTEIISPLSNRLSLNNSKLTPSEIRISNLVSCGKSTKEIADLLNLSAKTIETHRKNIRRKLGLKNSKANLRMYLISSR